MMDLFKSLKKKHFMYELLAGIFTLILLYKLGAMGYEFGQWIKNH